MSKNINIGDRVEVISKKLKTYGQKGTIKRLDFPLYVLATRESGHSDFHERFETVTFRNGAKVYVRSDLVDEWNTVLVSLDGGRHITTSLSNLKVISKATRPSVDINSCYILSNPHGQVIKGQVVDCEFNENREDGFYIFHSICGAYDIINIANHDIKKMNNEEWLNFTQIRAENQKRIAIAEKRNKLFSVVIRSETLNTIVDRYSSKEQFGGFFDNAIVMDRSYPKERSFSSLRDFENYNLSFTVKGHKLEVVIEDIVQQLHIDPRDIEVYELVESPKSVKVNVSVDIE